MNQPFQLIAEVKTPFHMRFPVTLDALLSAALGNKLGMAEEDTTDHIPLEMESGIFKGSSLQPGRRPVITQVGRVQALRGPRDISSSAFSPNKYGKTYTAVDTKRGPYKTNLDAYEAIACQSVHWYGMGDAYACQELISDYLIGIGKRSNGGAGELGNIEVLLLDEDYSWVLPNGKPARPIPVAVWESIGGMESPIAQLTTVIPYATSPRSASVFPAF